MIIVAGLSPAWQQILSLPELRLGAVNRADEVHWTASGKVINVAIALSTLGADCLAIAPLGGTPAAAMRAELDSLRVRGAWVETAAPTRVCTTLLDRLHKQTTELVENAPPLSQTELSAVIKAYEQAAPAAGVVVLTGSLPATTPVTFFCELLSRTPSSAAAVLDIRGPELLEVLAASPLLPRLVVKPNRDELAATLARPLHDDRQLVAAMRELNVRGAQWVVVTQGKDAVWAVSSDVCYRAAPPQVPEAVNPIGCGDCLAAGLAWALDKGLDFRAALPLAIAAAVENLTQLLPSRLDRRRVERRALSVDVETSATFG